MKVRKRGSRIRLVRSAKYKVQSTKYKVRSSEFGVGSREYEVPGTWRRCRGRTVGYRRGYLLGT